MQTTGRWAPLLFLAGIAVAIFIAASSARPIHHAPPVSPLPVPAFHLFPGDTAPPGLDGTVGGPPATGTVPCFMAGVC